ncbi:RAMP superfamily protein [Scytonema sp. UIC 10036]|uniref:RAMP superfamily CRISPR-associated protein n=1 Tax=Scytonema sp. UIC 10036 TaxID=2304196 RepID=UPI0012DA7686|nr:RAMP superfamily CRISPR-associated protein [Scytonema sp. UIC 10036]MUG93048.1 RAMP superfamily protein [Scytonema sp. UIC 10036]
MYTGPQLAQLLENQHQRRANSDLFKQGNFTLYWRTKVGSFPHPDVETIVSAGEPCGAWCPTEGRPEDRRTVGDNLDLMSELPLNGYIPASSIRGVVRAWAIKRPSIRSQMLELLGYQKGNVIQAGKIEFLDAWPVEPTKLVLDIVNPQQEFQVYHQGQGTPLSLYTLGNGEDGVEVTVAIRGISGKATRQDVETVWEWVQQALGVYGVGSRTSVGYGCIKAPNGFQPSPELRQAENGYTSKTFEFTLYTQGCAGPDREQQEFRPSHWRGWLRSWVLRFLLGVMSKENAEKTLWELMGTLEPKTHKGCVRISMTPRETWGERSTNLPYFYVWQGKLQVTAPSKILNTIILPIMKFAVSVGGVGRGWRRPLHIFHMDNRRAFSRGSLLIVKHHVRNQEGQWQIKLFGLPLNPESWTSAYERWLTDVRSQWADRINIDANRLLAAEVFSPKTCAIYAVPGPDANPIDENDFEWLEPNAIQTRGEGMHLIYEQTPPYDYKRNPDVGGNAANGDPHCSWVSIKRVNIRNRQENTECQEIVCLFMGGKTPQSNHIRCHFLQDLDEITGAVRLFGVQP